MRNWDDDSEDGQRMKNLLLFNAYVSDKEMSSAAPFVAVFFIVLVIILVALALV